MLLFVALAALFLLLGAWSFRRITGVEAFAVADRTAPTGMVFGSLVATVVGGSSTLGMAGLGFSKGLVGAWWLLAGAVGLAVLGLTLVPRVRNGQAMTLPELIGSQYGETVKSVASLLITAAWTGIIAGQMVSAGKLMASFSPLPQSEWITGCGLVFVVYAALGGQHSVLRTDAFQAALLTVGIVAAAWLGVHAAGGWHALSVSLPPSHLAFPVGAAGNAPFVARMLLLVGATYLVGPDVYSRLFCARDDRSARTATMLTALVLVPLALVVTTTGLVARARFPELSPEQAFPTVVAELLPQPWAVLVLAGLLAALISSADTCLVTGGVILGLDLLRDRCCPQMSKATQLLTCRLCVCVLGGLALCVALLKQSIIGSLMVGYTVYTAGLVVPVLAGFFRDRLRLNAGGALTSIVLGGGLALWAKFGPPFGPWHSSLDLLALAASAAGLFVGSRVYAALGISNVRPSP